jgi:hypothetical protein
MSERRATAKAAADKFIVACVAPGTLKGYKKKWVKWLTFAREHGYLLAPPRPSDLEDYLTSEVVARGSVTVIDSISASFNWHCAKVGYDSPFLNNKNCSDREGNEKATSQVKWETIWAGKVNWDRSFDWMELDYDKALEHFEKATVWLQSSRH